VKVGAIRHEGQIALGVVREDEGRAVITLWPEAVGAAWPDPLAALDALPPPAGPSFEIPSTAELLPPVPNPGKIFCVGANYEAHRKEMGRDVPAHPLVFMRTAMTLRGHRQPLWAPPESEQFDYEGEVAVVIGRPGRRISPEAAWEHVAGLSAFNDATIRDWQRHSSQFTGGKNFDATGGFGPWLVTPDALPEPSAIVLTTRVNGEVRQQGSLSDLTFSIPDLIAYVSTFATLVPGDVIVTGTPAGVGHAHTPPRYLAPGDEVEVEVATIGTLSSPVIRDPLAG